MSTIPLWQGGGAIDDLGSVTGSSPPTTLTTGAANTKGSWAQLIASTTQTYTGLIVTIRSTSGSKYTIDIGIGAGGSEVVILPDLLTENGNNQLVQRFIPLSIPAGVRVAARAQDDSGGNSVFVNVHGITGSATVPVGYQRATTYGFTAASTTGTVVDAGAAANTKGAYAQLTASTTNPIKQLYVSIGSPATLSSANASLLVDVAVGAAASEQVVIPNLSARNPNGNFTEQVHYGPFPVNIAAGTRLSARAQCDVTDANGRTIQLTVLGLD